MAKFNIVLFDGVCNLCNAAVQFILANDSKSRFRFASLQSDAAGRLLSRVAQENEVQAYDSLILIEVDEVYRKSTAALRIARKLNYPWPLLYPLIYVPTRVRDSAYDFIAKNRYRWFGRKMVCRIPTKDEADKFLD